MVWVRNERLPELGRRGRNVFPKYELGAKRLTKKWYELTKGRKICVPACVSLEIKHLKILMFKQTFRSEYQ